MSSYYCVFILPRATHTNVSSHYEQDFKIVQEKDPSNASLPQELLELVKRQKVQDSKAKKTFSKMFS